MQIKYIKEGKELIIKLKEEIDHHSSEKIRKRVDYEIQVHIPKKIIFDFEHVTFMDSSGIGMLIGRYKLVSMLGGKTAIINVSAPIKKVLEMSGILKIISIEELENIRGDNFEKCI